MDSEDEGKPLGSVTHIYPLGEDHDIINPCWCNPDIEHLEDREIHIHHPRILH
jgi:hypothetical protein